MRFICGILALVSVTFAKKQVLYIISGSDAFGGHMSQWFTQPISDVISLTSQHMDKSTEFGVLWTIPGAPRPSYKVVSRMQNRTKILNWEVNRWMHSDSLKAKASKWTGLRGSIQFALEKMFSEDAEKVIITMTHMNMKLGEIDLFLRNNCSQVLVTAIVFPWPWLDCKVPQMTRVLTHFNNKLLWTGYFTHDLAICGREFRQIQQLGQTIDIEIPNMKKAYLDFCPQPTTTPIPVPVTAPVPTTTPKPIIRTELVIIKETGPPPCQFLWCQEWLVQFYFLENMVIIFVIILILLIIFCRFCCFPSYKTKPKSGFALRDGLWLHHKGYAPQCCRVGYTMPLKKKKLKRRGSKGSLLSRKSKVTVSDPDQDQRHKEDTSRSTTYESTSPSSTRTSTTSTTNTKSSRRKELRHWAAEGMSLGALSEVSEDQECRSIQSAPAERITIDTPLVTLYRRGESHQVVTGPSIGPTDKEFLLELQLRSEGRMNQEFLDQLNKEATVRQPRRKHRRAKNAVNHYYNTVDQNGNGHRPSLTKIAEAMDPTVSIEWGQDDVTQWETMPQPTINPYGNGNNGRRNSSRRSSNASSASNASRSRLSREESLSKAMAAATAPAKIKVTPKPAAHKRSVATGGDRASLGSQKKAQPAPAQKKPSQTGNKPQPKSSNQSSMKAKPTANQPSMKAKTTPTTAAPKQVNQPPPQRTPSIKSAPAAKPKRPVFVDLKPQHASPSHRARQGFDNGSMGSRKSSGGSQRQRQAYGEDQASPMSRGFPSPSDSAYGSSRVSMRSAGKPPVSPRGMRPFQLHITHHFDYQRAQNDPPSTASTPRRPFADEGWPQMISSTHSTPTRSIRKRSRASSLPNSKHTLVNDPDVRFERQVWIPPGVAHPLPLDPAPEDYA